MNEDQPLVWLVVVHFTCPTISSVHTLLYFCWSRMSESFPGDSAVKNPPTNAGDAGDSHSIPGLGRSPEGGNGNPFQYSCLENFMDRGDYSPWGHKESNKTE